MRWKLSINLCNSSFLIFITMNSFDCYILFSVIDLFRLVYEISNSDFCHIILCTDVLLSWKSHHFTWFTYRDVAPPVFTSTKEISSIVIERASSDEPAVFVKPQTTDSKSPVDAAKVKSVESHETDSNDTTMAIIKVSFIINSWSCFENKKVASPEQGLEPWTLRLKVWCSTDWAIRAAVGFPLYLSWPQVNRRSTVNCYARIHLQLLFMCHARVIRQTRQARWTCYF